jgi:hypothetical protein
MFTEFETGSIHNIKNDDKLNYFFLGALGLVLGIWNFTFDPS